MKLTPEQKIEVMGKALLATDDWKPEIGMLLTQISDSLSIYGIEEVTPNEIHTMEWGSGQPMSFSAKTRKRRLVPIPQDMYSALHNPTEPLQLKGVGGMAHAGMPEIVTLEFNRAPTHDERCVISTVVSDKY